MSTLEERHDELVKILQSFEILEKSKEWVILKDLVYDRELSSVERQLFNASLENPLDIAKLYTLQGRRAQAKKYEINHFIETLKKELESVNKQIK